MSQSADIVDAKPPQTPVEWTEENRIIPPGKPEPGPFRYRRTPYMVPVANAFAETKYRRVTCVTGTQMGKSATFHNVMGWKLDEDPAPVNYIGPTESNINKVVEPTFMEMVQECQSLSSRFLGGKGESSKHRKVFGGVHLRFAWAGSPSEIASDSAALTLVDEIDRRDNNATGEGALEDIAEARGDAFADSKTGYTSTPIEGKAERETHPETGYLHWAVGDPKRIGSAIWKLWQNGTRHEWMVPHLDVKLPDGTIDKGCGEYFSPTLDLLWWPGKGTENECSPSVAAKEARLTCPHCGGEVHNKSRQSMNAYGRAVAPGQRVDPKTREVIGTADTDENDSFSIWISGLCSFSAKKSYGYIAKKLLEALVSGDPGKIQAVYNTGGGEIFALSGDVPDWEEVYNLRSTYQIGTVPEGFDKLICTVDVQKNRVYYVVRAWRAGMSSRLIENGEIWGDTEKPQIWQEMDDFFERTWDGKSLNLMGVDCAYRDEAVHAFVRRHKSKARALRGLQSQDKPYAMVRIDVDKKGKTLKRGDKRWNFNTTLAKAWVHSRVSWQVGTNGDWLLPSDIDKDYCKQIVAEEFDEETGFFKKIATDNHYLDCEGMQFMCAKMLRLDRKKPPAEQTDNTDEMTDKPLSEEPTPKKTKPKPKKRPATRKKAGRGGFVSRGRVYR